VFFCLPSSGIGSKQWSSSDETTYVEIETTYNVESAVPLLDVCVCDIELGVVEAAISGALQCSDTAAKLNSTETPLDANTTLLSVATCAPELNATNQCGAFKSSFAFQINRKVDSEVASVLAYLRIQEVMNSGELANHTDAVDRFEYVSPAIPILPPIVSDPEAPETDRSSSSLTSNSLSVSPWTLGAVVATSKCLCPAESCSN
jgi:hypothetical protein